MSRLFVRLEKLARALATRPRRQTVKRLVVAHHLLLGDTVLLAPLLKALAERYPDAERWLLARPAVVPLFEARPYGFTALPFERRDSVSQRAVLRSGPYDLALVPDDNRYAWLARAAGARWIVGFAGDRPAWKNWMCDERVPYSRSPQAWADMAVALAGVGRVDPYQPGEWPAPRSATLTLPAAPYAVLHVGASTPLKEWPARRWRELADRLAASGLHIVWSAGASEKAMLKDVGPRADESDCAGRYDLAQLWQLLAHARLVILPDTGVAHLARLVGAPTLALFGPGSSLVHGAGEFFAGAPYRAFTIAEFHCRDQRVLYRREIDWVRRCGRGFGHGPLQCAHARCMDALPLAAVHAAALELLALPRA